MWTLQLHSSQPPENLLFRYRWSTYSGIEMEYLRFVSLVYRGLEPFSQSNKERHTEYSKKGKFDQTHGDGEIFMPNLAFGLARIF